MVGADLGHLGLDAAPVVEAEVRYALAERAIGLANVSAVVQVLLPGGPGRNNDGIVVGEQSVGLEQRNEFGEQESGLLTDQSVRVGSDARDRVGEVLERQPNHPIANRLLHAIQPNEPGRRHRVRCEDEQAGVRIVLELLSMRTDLVPIVPLRRVTAARGLGLEPPCEPRRDPGIGDSADVDDLILERDRAQLLAGAGGAFEQLLDQGKIHPLEHRHHGGGDTVLTAAVRGEQRVRHESTLASADATERSLTYKTSARTPAPEDLWRGRRTGAAGIGQRGAPYPVLRFTADGRPERSIRTAGHLITREHLPGDRRSQEWAGVSPARTLVASGSTG